MGPAFHAPRIFFLDKKLIRHYDEHCFSRTLVEFFLVEKTELQTGIKVLASYTAHSHFTNIFKESNEVSITQLTDFLNAWKNQLKNVHLLTYFLNYHCFIVLI